MEIINLENHFDSFFEKIKELPYGHNGMFNSELFVIYSVYNTLKCDLFIESGIDNAVSTKKLLSFINDDYYGIDVNPNCLGKSLENKNFKFINGDSSNEIKKIINENTNKNIFILIDGPKGEQATWMKNELLNYDCVSVVALHDTCDGLQNDNLYRIFETSSNRLYNDIFFHRLNLFDYSEIQTIYNLLNHSETLTYFDTFQQGPGVSVYSKKNIQIEI